MGRIGSWVPWQVMLAALAPHCWNATSFAEPEYVMDFTSPSAFCASAITVLASCASALPHRTARPTLIRTSFLNTASPYDPGCQAQRTRLEYSISTWAGVALASIRTGRSSPARSASSPPDRHSYPTHHDRACLPVEHRHVAGTYK